MMKLSLLSSFLLVSTSGIKPKICINCKHFLYSSDNKLAKCVMFPIIEHEDIFQKRKEFIDFLVSGHEKPKKLKPIEYSLCCTAREFGHMCGNEGKKYEERVSTF